MFARQGDVGLIKRDTLPTGAEPVSVTDEDIILAEGEVTGHAHRVAAHFLATLFVAEGVRLLQVQAETRLTHEEHNEIILEPGVYEVRQQREYTPERVRPVAD